MKRVKFPESQAKKLSVDVRTSSQPNVNLIQDAHEPQWALVIFNASRLFLVYRHVSQPGSDTEDRLKRLMYWW
jgi:hypothetical protein